MNLESVKKRHSVLRAHGQCQCSYRVPNVPTRLTSYPLLAGESNRLRVVGKVNRDTRRCKLSFDDTPKFQRYCEPIPRGVRPVPRHSHNFPYALRHRVSRGVLAWGVETLPIDKIIRAYCGLSLCGRIDRAFP